MRLCITYFFNYRAVKDLNLSDNMKVLFWECLFFKHVDLNYFKNIIPCGIVDKGVTSLETELGRKIDLEEVKNKLLNNFSTLFHTEIVKNYKL